MALWFGPLVKIFGPPVFIYSALRIRPYGPDSFKIVCVICQIFGWVKSGFCRLDYKSEYLSVGLKSGFESTKFFLHRSVRDLISWVGFNPC